MTLNLAASLDGRVSAPDGGPLRLSSPQDASRVHRLRARSDAVVVGVGTVLADDPRLTARTRPPAEHQPLRVVLDTRRRTPPDARVVDGEAPTLVLAGSPGPDRLASAEVVQVGEGRPAPGAVLEALERRGVERVLVEGGPRVARAFLEARAVDLFHLYVAPRILGAGVSLPAALEGLDVMLEPRGATPMGEGVLLAYGVET